MPRLTLSDLATVLDRYAPRYQAIDVFADDVVEVAALNSTNPPQNLIFKSIDHSNQIIKYGFTSNFNGNQYSITLFYGRGIVRLSRDQEQIGPFVGGATIGATAGGAIGAAIANAASQKGDAWPVGLLLGLLVGATLGGAIATPGEQIPQRVFTLRFDPQTNNWAAYDGGLVRWMKDTMVNG